MITDRIDRIIKENGIDLYRQDFNMDPLPLWQSGDAPNQRGMTENGHVAGYMAFWDELQRRNPNMLIDSCASGGRRNDMESVRRSIPLLRSDYRLESIGNQGMTYGLASCELYDPTTGTFSTTGSLVYQRAYHTATLLGDGKVLVVGGRGTENPAPAEVYDPATGSFALTGSLRQRREHHTATLLPDGNVLIIGGYGPGGPLLASVELYDTAAGTFTTVGSLIEARKQHKTVLLPSGKLLVVGGDFANPADTELGTFLSIVLLPMIAKNY